jgi:uncharacterized membrane protein HdeD (DUF308 family)
MTDVLGYVQRSWWLFLLRGIAAIGFGIMAFAWPALTLGALVVLFGAYVLVDAVFGLVDALRTRTTGSRIWPVVLESVLGIIVGLLTLLMPGVSALVLLMFVAAWAIVGGLLRIVLAFQIRKEITGEWILIVGGVLSILFGTLLIVLPQVGIVTLAWVIGIYAIAFGFLFVVLAVRLRRLGQDLHILSM